ncbi:alpha-ketoglutarate-dependent sulfonate dioxygenase [Russula aff. rugulosa BPL654]|nr:alpha-ketoglutarate-dependent sulfonate dioxygenase [Russula aff. rugulosa BPL654]
MAVTSMAAITTATKREQKNGQPINPFYSPSFTDDGKNEQYKYAQYKPSFPDVSWEPLKEVKVIDKGLLLASSDKKTLLSAASKVITLTPTIGTELQGIDLRQLSDAQKDELSLLVAERGVVFFRNQNINIHEQLELARHWGPLHRHATTPIPKEPGLEEVHVVYSTSSPRTDPFPSVDLWHSDTGGDTLWSSGYALYSSLSPGLQIYLEGLSALHSAVAQADGARASGIPIRREPIETVHPVIRVHPATGWKSVYVNPGFTRRIVDVPKVESDAILAFLFAQISQNQDFQVRFKWEPNDIAIWDNRVVTHSATFDFWPVTRHALRATPHGERPISVADYERTTGKRARNRQLELWERLGIVLPEQKEELTKSPGYND